jgi:ubiquinone/menaquinone biosynthesis C-methylase UbiE
MSFLTPKNIVDKIKTEEGVVIADFGTGSGEYVFAFGKKEPRPKTIYAIDVNKDMLKRVLSESSSLGIHNVKAVWGDLEQRNGSTLGNESVDLVIFSNILFQLEDKASAVKEAFRILKTGGRVFVIDWSTSSGVLGPSFENIFIKKKALEIFSENSFEIKEEIEAGDHHYGFIGFKK